jgi:hypothetical protein
MTSDNPNTPLQAEWEVEQEDFTPEGPLKDGQEIIDGNFIIDKNGVKRRPNGHPFPGGQGIRPAGKKTASFREFKHSMLIAFHANGGTQWLTEWGREHPALFFKLMAKMIPQATLEGAAKTAIEVNIAWATKERLSYQHPPLINEAAAGHAQTDGTWKEPQEESGVASVLRDADKPGKG